MGRLDNLSMNLRPLFLVCLACVSACGGAGKSQQSSTCLNTDPFCEFISSKPALGPLESTLPNQVIEPNENLLVNGSFEVPALAPETWDVFPEVPGWLALAGPGIEIQHATAGPAHDGEQHAELDSQANSAMVQTVAVQSGHTYELRFWTMARPGTEAETNGLDVFVNDVLVRRVQHAPTEQYTEEQVLWTAGPGVRQASLRFEATGSSDTMGSYLDAVSFRRKTLN